MSCYCDDLDRPEFSKVTHPKARKPCRCCDCGREIAIGETYEHVTGRWDNYFAIFRSCESCEDLRESLISMGYCVAYGEARAIHADYLCETRRE